MSTNYLSNMGNYAREASEGAKNWAGRASQGAVQYIPKAPPMIRTPLSSHINSYVGNSADAGDCHQPHILYYIFMTILLMAFGSSLVLTFNSIADTSDTTTIYQILSSVLLLFFCLIMLYYAS